MVNRTAPYRKNLLLEKHIQDLNEILEGAENEAIEGFQSPSRPVVLLVGCARSGTTLFMQWLNSLGMFWCPTNFVSRFYSAPVIGLKIQQLLLDPNLSFGSELAGIAQDFESDLGKTKGWLSPSEFWYFWREHFQFESCSMKERPGGNARFLSELAALESATGRVLAFKAMIANVAISQMNAVFKKVVFVHLVRERIYNAQSLLESRKAHGGSIDEWWSFEVPNQEELQSRSPYEQVIGQVEGTNQLISEQLAQVADSRKLAIKYEWFCENPELVFTQLLEKINSQEGVSTGVAYNGPNRYSVSKTRRLEHSAWECLVHADNAEPRAFNIP